MISVDIRKQLQAGAGRIALALKFDIHEGEVLALFGPSGSGKTSAMRMIAGLLRPDAGVITVNGQTWFDSQQQINERPQQRDIGVVFQDYALFPNMSVRENVHYALKKGESAKGIDEVLEVMELTAMRDVRPDLLSGGQKQRVALARAIVRRSPVLLLDEPTSALDAALRNRMQDYIKAVSRQSGSCTLLITHDVMEVVRLASRVLVIDQGVIATEGSPVDVLPLDDLRSLLGKTR